MKTLTIQNRDVCIRDKVNYFMLCGRVAETANEGSDCRSQDAIGIIERDYLQTTSSHDSDGDVRVLFGCIFSVPFMFLST